ncbi:MAG: bifunctional phosphopantothenoylcysteine decarboxylase/phosphopantothenate--cysteine ligase CoaBC [Gammaproteobacteria bacterium]|nr:bifunctional phosphopantothenoylcysteine decarboxylase/phosphopantothenate--cysteine ligase CoaBC [Gammaproteobacteria bacterium]
MHLQNKKITLGITGCIAAYKAAELIRILKKQGAEVQVIMTKNAQEFITPLTLQTLSQRTVYCEQFRQDVEHNIEHISAARWSDLILIAPATANIMAKITHGIADDLLSTTCLATTAPIAFAPAMNKEMWAKDITQENVQKLIARGCHIFGPATGWQACEEVGPGRMIEPAELSQHIQTLFTPKLLANKHIVITAGPTMEPIDPVRFISNHSSGKMGYALAAAAISLGADVTLISGKTQLTPPHGAQFQLVNTTNEMYQATMQASSNCDIFIATAAVADYKITQPSSQKIKKQTDNLTLELTKNPDILASVAALPNPPFTIGFAAETEQLSENAIQKLNHKKLNMIAANLVGPETGFDKDENELLVITKTGEQHQLTKKLKSILAHELLTLIAKQIT